ncbi:MAG: hypothetical protein R6X31_11170 [Anaerolineae bacterium]
MKSRQPLRRGSGQGLSRRTVTFIVRVWAEYLEQTPPVLRGEIEDVQSKEVRRFGSLSAMNDWMGRLLNADRQESEQEEA